VVAELVHQHGHQLSFREATGWVFLHDPAGDRDAASAGRVRVWRPSGLDVELDLTGIGSGHFQGRRPCRLQRHRLRRAGPMKPERGAKGHSFADSGHQHSRTVNPRQRKK